MVYFFQGQLPLGVMEFILFSNISLKKAVINVMEIWLNVVPLPILINYGRLAPNTARGI
jgi:hypothetical protein